MEEPLLCWSPGILYLEFLSNVFRLGFSLAAMCCWRLKGAHSQHPFSGAIGKLHQ